MRWDVRTNVVIWFSLVGGLPLGLARDLPAPAAFVVVGSDFHTRDQDDAGEVRICLQNTGAASLSLAQLRVRVISKTPGRSDTMGSEQKLVYAKLSPPAPGPGQYGQLVAKLRDRPAPSDALLCTLSAGEGATSATVPVTESAVWISYVGFSPDLRRAFVYVENTSDKVVRLESLQVGDAKVEDATGFVNRLVPPKDKGCLIHRLSTALTPGEFVHVAVSARRDDQNVRLHAMVRAINRIPLVMVESDTPTPGLGLDGEGFTETMACIAHAHGTPEQAATEFLEDYVQRFRRSPRQVIQVDICRSDSPRAWFRFGSLPDVARMNPILSPPPRYEKEDHKQWFDPFFYRGCLAKKAVEPCRYVAVISLTPDEDLFFQKELTPQEVKFLTCCAIASGAKGLSYRRLPPDDPLNHSAFVRSNQELRQIEPLLLMGEPVDWATAADNHYAANSLLCGDQAIIALVFDHRYFSRQRTNRFYTPPFGRAVTPVKVDMKIPGELCVGQVRSLFAPLERGAWIYREGVLSFTADMIESVQIYLVDLQSRTQPSGVGESSR